MFRWLKKKCKRSSMLSGNKRLFKPEERVQENEYHIYEEIPDIYPSDELAYAVVSLEHTKFDHQMEQTETDCPVCKYGHLDQDIPCVCQEQKTAPWDEFDMPIMPHSSSVMAIDKHFPRIPVDLGLPPRSRKPVSELVTSCDSSSGYDSNSSSSLDIGIEDDILERLDNMHLENYSRRGDNLVIPRMGCRILQRRNTILNIQSRRDVTTFNSLPRRPKDNLHVPSPSNESYYETIWN
ncbi:hypothetical protein SNE40_016538 [Patella caerulea]|uniref:Uncharacterized protein n=1 Tax=Patella caerulea TaxID=87958 RepID=A0AAN8PNQ2_PATCE